MKEAGYRSFPNYASAIKDLHVTEGHPWSDMLAAAVTHATASTQRGIGPPHQCGEIKLPDALSVIHNRAPLVPGGPADCGNMFTMAYFHVARGMELVCADAVDLTVDCNGLTETWTLSVSKTDPQAIGCRRTWGCTCRSSPVAPCPVHAALAHLQWLRDQFAMSDGSLPATLPLFPSTDGTRATADSLNASVEAVAARLGLPLVDSMGRTAFTEHIFRVSGSRMLARRGIPVETIMLLARWASDVIRRYIGDAPLDTLTTAYVDGRPPPIVDAVPPAPMVAPVWGSELQAPMTERPPLCAGPSGQGTDSLTARLDTMAAQVEHLTAQADPRFVLNHRSGVFHQCGEARRSTTPALWKTTCGWPFGAPGVEASWVTSLDDADPDLICGTCLPRARIDAILANGC